MVQGGDCAAPRGAHPLVVLAGSDSRLDRIPAESGHRVSAEGAVSNSQPCSTRVGSAGHGPHLRSGCGAELPAQGCALGPGGRESSLPARR